MSAAALSAAALAASAFQSLFRSARGTHAVGAEQWRPSRRVIACNHEARGLAKGGREDGKAVRGSGSSVWRGRRGQTQPQREWPPRPPEPPTPDVPITARLARAHSASIIASERSAIARHSSATQVGRRILSAASHGESPPFVRRRPAIRRRRVPKTARPLRSICFLWSVFIAYLGSLSRATTSLLP